MRAAGDLAAVAARAILEVDVQSTLRHGLLLLSISAGRLQWTRQQGAMFAGP